MRGPFARTLSREIQEKLQLAAAVAAEGVLAEHVRFALELLDEGADRAPVERLLAAYARLHYMDDDDFRQLRDRVLVALGRDPEAVSNTRLHETGSVFHRVRSRFRGRVHLELRGWVDRHTARAELAVLDVHVEHARRFLQILDGHAPQDQAIELYVDTLELRPTMGEMVRLTVLAGRDLEAAGADDVADVEALRPGRPREFPLRLAEDGG